MKVHIVRWRLQFGLALTLPITRRRAVILSRKWPIPEKTRKHEMCHTRQIERWGVPGYWARHIWARIVTRNFYAANHPVETECYAAEDQ